MVSWCTVKKLTLILLNRPTWGHRSVHRHRLRRLPDSQLQATTRQGSSGTKHLQGDKTTMGRGNNLQLRMWHTEAHTITHPLLQRVRSTRWLIIRVIAIHLGWLVILLRSMGCLRINLVRISMCRGVFIRVEGLVIGFRFRGGSIVSRKFSRRALCPTDIYQT